MVRIIFSHAPDISNSFFSVTGSCIVKPLKPFFVRRCTNCRIIWDRDYNASQNIIYVAKRVFEGVERDQLFANQIQLPIIPNKNIFPTAIVENEEEESHQTDQIGHAALAIEDANLLL